jgi:four helix bundle protein
MGGFKDLIVWQKGIDVTVVTYELCKLLPATERYGLASQMKRAAVAIPSNIAEGYRRNNRKEYAQFCGIALGSAAELETQLIITSKVYPKIDISKAMGLCIEIQKMLNSLIGKLRM